VAFGHRNLLPRALPQLNERRREAQKLLPRWRESCATLVSDKQRPSELLLKEAHARADRRLRDMQAFCGFDEASSRDDLYEGSGKLDIHSSSNTILADKYQLYSLVCLVNE
jgi:hypothetical protein